MFRTVKVKLPIEQSLIQTAIAFNEACQIVLDYGSQNKTCNKAKLNKATYNITRIAIPNLPSALVQTARDQASEILKRTSYAKANKQRLTVRYDNRTFKFYPDTDKVSLATVHGRLTFHFKHYNYMDTWRGQYTNAQLVVRKNRILLNIQVKIENNTTTNTGKTIGIDRGILNIAVCSDGTFYSSNHLRAVKGRYRYQQRCLMHVGTRSAHRKLQRLSGRERRFVQDTNHCITKAIVNKPFDIFAIEDLAHICRTKKRGNRFNRLIGSWSPYEFERFLKYKAEQKSKVVVSVKPEYTSQRCSKCGFSHKWNRHGLRFRCGNCGFELNADLNASRNIDILGRSEYVRLLVNKPIVASDEALLTGKGNDGYKSISSD